MSRRDFETTRALSRRAGMRPRANEKPFLLGIAGEHAGRFFPLEGIKELLIGRAPECEIPIVHDDIISRRHARVEVTPVGEVRISDLGSTNGTLVNGREIASTAMQRGDRIFLGQSTILKFDYLSEDERSRWESATFDALTECHNRAFFEARLVELHAMARESGRPLSLVMLDVDHFKSINDRFGHQAGDFALQQVAQAIDTYLARRETPAYTCRYGGEEFVVLLPGCDAGTARDHAEGLRRAVAEVPLRFEDAAFTMTVSGGTSTLHDGEPSEPAELLRLADENLYRAKQEGRNRVVG